MRVWVRALVVAAPLVTMLGVGVPAQAGAAAAPTITPANGSVVTSSSVTIRVKSALAGGTLYVDGRPVATGKNQWLTYTINGKTTPNGTHNVKLEAILPWDEASSTFRMAVPASAPSGVTASVAGNKVTVRWNKGAEPDLTGYTLSGDLGTKSVSAKSCGAQCSVTLTAPANVSGQATIQVAAKRAGAAASGASTRTVRLKGTSQSPSGDGNGSGSGNGNAPAPAPSNYTWPQPSQTSQSPLFPTVAPTPDGFSTESPDVSIVYPTPTDAPGVDTSVVGMDDTGLTGTVADESLQWGKSVAIALVLLLCAAHLGTWTRRLRTARAIGPGALRVVQGSAHARVEANRMRIEAALAAARGTTTELHTPPDDGTEDSGNKGKSPESETLEVNSIVRTVDPDQEFPDELNIEYTPRSVGMLDYDTIENADTIETTENAETDDVTVTLTGETVPEEAEQDRAAIEKTDAALAALIELAKADAPSETASDRTEVLEHPRRRGFFGRRP